MTAALGVGMTVGVVLMLEYRDRKRRGFDAAADPEDDFVILDVGLAAGE